jgi:hypothetical protein
MTDSMTGPEADLRRAKLLAGISKMSPDEEEEFYARYRKSGQQPQAPAWTYETALAEGFRYAELARVTAEDDNWKRYVTTSMNNTSRLELANYYQTRALSFLQLAQLLKP